MNILIIGASGILGRSFCKLAQTGRHRITALVRNDDKSDPLKRYGVHLVRGSLLDVDSIRRCISGHDVILNFASSIPRKAKTSAKDWEMNDQIRTIGTSNILKCLPQENVFYCQAGICFVYGNHKGAWVNENSTIYPNSITNSGYEMEKLFLDFRHESLFGVSFRFAAFYHEEAWHTQFMLKELRNRRLPVIGDGNYYWNLIYADDAASAVIRVLENRDQIRSREIINVSDDQPVLCKEFLSHLCGLLNVQEPTRFPQFVARLVLGGESVEILTASYRCITEKIKKFGWNPKFPSFREGFSAVLQSI